MARGTLGRRAENKALRVLNLADDFCATHFKTDAQKIACIRGAKFTFDEATRARMAGLPLPTGKPRRVRVIRER